MDEPGGVSYYGSIAATPYAKIVIEDIIKYKKYKPTKPEELEDDFIQFVKMPSVVGKDVYVAINLLESAGLQVEIQGSGNLVQMQYPAPESEIIANSVVMIDVGEDK